MSDAHRKYYHLQHTYENVCNSLIVRSGAEHDIFLTLTLPASEFETLGLRIPDILSGGGSDTPEHHGLFLALKKAAWGKAMDHVQTKPVDNGTGELHIDISPFEHVHLRKDTEHANTIVMTMDGYQDGYGDADGTRPTKYQNICIISDSVHNVHQDKLVLDTQGVLLKELQKLFAVK